MPPSKREGSRHYFMFKVASKSPDDFKWLQMFRNSREHSQTDVGRPPTPPGSSSSTHSPPARATKETRPNASNRTLSAPRTTPMKPSPSRNKPGGGGGNASILSFFKKAEQTKPEEGDSLFLSDDEAENAVHSKSAQSEAPTALRDEADRYNENINSLKRRKTDSSPGNVDASLAADPRDGSTALQEINISNSQEVDHASKRLQIAHEGSNGLTKSLPPDSGNGAVNEDITQSHCVPPSLSREPTSAFDDGFEGMEDFADDEFPDDGEETIERRYMEEQRLLELEFEADDEVTETPNVELDIPPTKTHDPAAACPICNVSLEGIETDKISQHVNDCLDGKNPGPPQKAEQSVADEVKPKIQPPINGANANPPYKRFQRAAIARPPQENPFTLDSTATGGSAFSKLMSSHAEDNAWAVAAANELAARGKPAYKRTCPFYKILPGFFICVDAFRYGAVEGCNAYFLSHFHSDHYVGLTSTWCHGPIYCSKVTGNLVRQQLRVDPKWVVDLDWDTAVEVPRTDGVRVTMIPANHCPGSSLYLFEKTIGRGPRPKQQRVLHCGDFRACPAHVQHPLLRPDVLDRATGKKREQKLDVCYLDTTYLTPKYAFPRQELVVQACADMCVSLSKTKVDGNDAFEQMKKQRAGSGMTKFVQREEGAESSTIDAAQEKGRGRLLVVVGTYSIGKERICIGIAKALNSKIFAAPGKQRICAALEDPELSALMTNDPTEAQVHMQMLMEIRAETLADYLTGYKPHFSRIVGFRPSGWNYRPPNSRFVESPSIQTVLHSDNWKPSYSMAELVPQRGSTRESSCFGVPYSEHSSFRELTMFCCALNIDKVIPTVNVGSAKSREKMKGWIDKWAMEKRKNGLYKLPDADVW